MAGLEEIKLEVKPEVFRDQTFDVIYVNGEKTSITTTMGSEWKFWQAIREVFCNAIDEGEAKMEFVMNIDPKEGETHFYLDVKQDVSEFVTNFDRYFVVQQSRVLFECPVGRILKKTGTKANVYRRGVRCYESDLLSAFDYDFNDITVNESRLVENWWQVGEKIWEMALRCDDKEVIMTILNHSSDQGFIEGGLWEYATVRTGDMSATFREVMETVRFAPKAYAGLLAPDEVHNHVILPHTVYKALQAFIPEENKGERFKTTIHGAMYKIIDPNSLQEAVIQGAMDFLKEAGFDMPYTIKLAVFDNKNIFGTVIGDLILLSETGLERGVNETVNTILEEYVHIKHGVQDKTRAMQTAIIVEWISYMKKKNAYVI